MDNFLPILEDGQAPTTSLGVELRKMGATSCHSCVSGAALSWKSLIPAALPSSPPTTSSPTASRGFSRAVTPKTRGLISSPGRRWVLADLGCYCGPSGRDGDPAPNFSLKHEVTQHQAPFPSSPPLRHLSPCLRVAGRESLRRPRLSFEVGSRAPRCNLPLSDETLRNGLGIY